MSRTRPAVSIDELPDPAQRRVRTQLGEIAVGKNSPLLDSKAAVNGQLKHERRQDLEHPEQVKLFAWANDAKTLERFPELDALYAIPNWFGSRTKRQGSRAKAEGRRKGMLDVCLPVPRRSHEGPIYGGCYLEMKDLGGSVRDSQQTWIHRLRTRGNFADVALSAESAKALLLYYLSLPKP